MTTDTRMTAREMVAEEIVIEPTYVPRSDPEAAWLVERVDDWLELEQKSRDSKGWFHASSLGKSDEELIARYQGTYVDHGHNATQLRVFDLGHDRDRSWKRYMAKSGLSIIKRKSERKFRIKELRLMGECDDIVRKDDGSLWVVEVKTIAPYPFSQLRGPKNDHRMQITCYMAGHNIERGIVIYENKGNQAAPAKYVPFDPAVWDGITERLRRLRAEAERA